MKQQYVLLKKENDSLNSLIGQSFNQKSKLEAQKIINEIHYLNSKAQSRMIAKTALCYIVDKQEIKGVGGSTLMKNKKTGEIFSNLILDQFGIILAGIFAHLPSGAKNTTQKDNGGTLRGLRIYTTGGSFTLKTTMGTHFKVGSGSTPPARTDFTLETPFATAPESGFFSAVSDPIFNSGLGNFKTAGIITAGGSGTINESILGNQFFDGDLAVIREFTLFRDIISPAQSFIAGQTIALEYTIQL